MDNEFLRTGISREVQEVPHPGPAALQIDARVLANRDQAAALALDPQFLLRLVFLAKSRTH